MLCGIERERRVGSTLSLMVFASSSPLPDLVITSTVRVNIGRLLLCSFRTSDARTTGRSRLQRFVTGGVGLATRCLNTTFGPTPSKETAAKCEVHVAEFSDRHIPAVADGNVITATGLAPFASCSRNFQNFST